MKTNVPESRVAAVWQSPVQRRTDLKTGDFPVRIIYPGRPNDGRGADMKDAVIATPQGIIKGDIEFHVKASGWRQHGHHRDPAYNSVVLHIVKEDDIKTAAALQDGAAVPTLTLGGYTEEQAGGKISSVFSPALPAACRAAPGVISGLLDEAGDARLRTKTAEYAESILREGAGRAFYRGVMTALGYSKNKGPMAKLADAAGLEELEIITSGAMDDDTCRREIEARLLGAAGLLHSQRFTGLPDDYYVMELESRWAKSGCLPQMSIHEWEFFKVRPGNYPVRRIAAMAALLTRYRRRGILPGLLNALEAAGEKSAGGLDSAFTLNADGYWQAYADFGLPVKGAAPALLGGERAGEIIINVLLPFAAAYAEAGTATTLKEKACDIYRVYPAGAENSLEKHMRRQLGLPGSLVKTARRRQGLIYIYKTLCTQGKCGICPLGKTAESGED